MVFDQVRTALLYLWMPVLYFRTNYKWSYLWGLILSGIPIVYGNYLIQWPLANYQDQTILTNGSRVSMHSLWAKKNQKTKSDQK